MTFYQMGYEKEFDWFGLEMFVGEEIMKNTLPIKIKQQAQIFFPTTKAVIEQAIHNFIEYKRQYDWCQASNHNDGKWIIDDSYGGPESGYMGYHCKKCGFSDGSILY